MFSALTTIVGLSAVSEVAGAGNEGALLPKDLIGFVVLGIIMVPVAVLVSAAVFGKPRNLRVSGLFVASLCILFVAMIAGFAAIGAAVGLIFPK